MRVIRHQTPHENVDAEAIQFLDHKIEVGFFDYYRFEKSESTSRPAA
jgi:hypothetical protein